MPIVLPNLVGTKAVVELVSRAVYGEWDVGVGAARHAGDVVDCHRCGRTFCRRPVGARVRLHAGEFDGCAH